MEKIKTIVKELLPPVLFKAMRNVYRHYRPSIRIGDGSQQDLDVYWENEMANILETWGEGNVWEEIKLIMHNCQGKVLDIACGTGKTMEVLSIFPQLELLGCDISDKLIAKAIERGIHTEKLKVCDATILPYRDNEFDYSYSIGSLEHFTETGIAQAIKEAHRVTKEKSYHMMPISKSGKDEGWLKTYQSFFNNSTEWWVSIFKNDFSRVHVVDSRWDDEISVGKWFVCEK